MTVRVTLQMVAVTGPRREDKFIFEFVGPVAYCEVGQKLLTVMRPTATAKHMLGIWRHRRDRLLRRPCDVRPELIQFCEKLVRELEALDPDVKITLLGRGSRGTDIIGAGRILATQPAHEDPKWWRDDGE